MLVCLSIYLLYISKAMVQANTSKETISKHRNIVPLYDLSPLIGPLSYVAPTATLVGEIFTGVRCHFWYGSVVRGDMNAVK